LLILNKLTPPKLIGKFIQLLDFSVLSALAERAINKVIHIGTAPDTNWPGIKDLAELLEPNPKHGD
jgi:hypothetical protein